MPATAFWCDLSEKASWSSRLTLYSLATASAVSPIPQYQSGWFLATSGLGTSFQPPNGMPDMTSTPPAIMASAMPDLILATAVALGSRPEAQDRTSGV